jgi:ubiquinone/menaquinone biosynthesis C-methylase UbiE
VTGPSHTPTLPRPARLTLACFAAVAIVGLAATLYGFMRAGGFPRISPALLAAAPLVVGATIVNLLVRFVRWHFLLRRVGVRVPTVPALGAFVGSFAFLPVPLYVGHLAARVRLLPLAPEQVPRVVLAFGVEQGLNVWALAVLASLAVRWWAVAALLAVAVLAFADPVRSWVLGLAATATAPVAGALATGPVAAETPQVGGVEIDGRVPGVAALLSLIAWGAVALAVLPLLWAVGGPVDVGRDVAAVARSILEGAWVPLGASVSGLALLRALRALGTTPASAAAVVFVFRAATAWLSVALGGAALLALGRARRHGHAHGHEHDHFDTIDACYDVWLPPHYRDHLVVRKTAPMIARLPALGGSARGLDIGCGRGWYSARMRAAGATMTGLDASGRQLVAARDYLGGGMSLVQGDALALPFAAAAFDFAYVINVLHHVATPPEQRDAVVEIGRVVRPGGLVFVHEMSARNPLFRLYLEYVYPLTKGIEEGTEYYLDPRRTTDLPGLRLLEVAHFTFIPDFAPRALLPWLARIEQRLEASPLAPWAAHFLAVYQRE